MPYELFCAVIRDFGNSNDNMCETCREEDEIGAFSVFAVVVNMRKRLI